MGDYERLSGNQAAAEQNRGQIEPAIRGVLTNEGEPFQEDAAASAVFIPAFAGDLKGAVGELFGPVALGAVAEAMGLIAVFHGVAGGVAFGALLVAALALLGARRSTKDSRQDGAVDVAAGDDAHHAAVASEPLQAGRH